MVRCVAGGVHRTVGLEPFAVTDHADTIRAGIGYGTTADEHDAASAALDALVAERQQAIDALRAAQHQCRENVRRAGFAPEIGTRYTEKLRLAIADECRKLEDGIGAALLSLGEHKQ